MDVPTKQEHSLSGPAGGRRGAEEVEPMRVVLLVSAMVVALALPAHAATKTVTASGRSFSPSSVGGPAGTTVRWEAGFGTHTVTSSTGMFDSGSPTDWPYSRVFSAGRYPYYCEIHGSPSGGMTGVVKIRPKISPAPAGKPFTVRWASGATNTGSSFTVQYRVNGGEWRPWRTRTSADVRVFGKGGSPVRVVDGRTYGFRAKSFKKGNASRFSPVRSFTP